MTAEEMAILMVVGTICFIVASPVLVILAEVLRGE